MSEAALTIIDGDRDRQPYAMAPITPMAMISQAVANGASIETVEKLMALQERYEAAQARKAFDNAMAEAKAEIPVIAKNREVDFTSSKGRTNYRHEDLAEIARTVNPILAKYGLSYRFRSSVEGAMVSVTCVVSHRAGYSEENTLTAASDESGSKNSIQAVGSSLTYLQRMTLKASLGLAASDDDDGRGAGASHDTIGEEQIGDLVALIESVGADKAAFLKFFRLEALADLPAAKFQQAVAMLNAKRGRG